MKNSNFVLTFIFMLCLTSNVIAAPTLWMTEQMINLRFDVDNISYQELHNKLQNTLPEIEQNNILLFDVRRAEEYQQSRIEGSIQIEPDMKVKDFIARYGDKINNKELIFYCSVGYRSSVFIERIDKQVKAIGVKSTSNLTGGIFRWYNEHLQVVNDQGVTDDIHPSNESWAHLIEPRKSIPNENGHTRRE